MEYDGEQHFMPIAFGNVSEKAAKVNFKKCQELVKLKNKKIKNNLQDVEHFIRFNYKEDLTEEYIINKINEAIKA